MQNFDKITIKMNFLIGLIGFGNNVNYFIFRAIIAIRFFPYNCSQILGERHSQISLKAILIFKCSQTFH